MKIHEHMMKITIVLIQMNLDCHLMTLKLKVPWFWEFPWSKEVISYCLYTTHWVPDSLYYVLKIENVYRGHCSHLLHVHPCAVSTCGWSCQHRIPDSPCTQFCRLLYSYLWSFRLHKEASFLTGLNTILSIIHGATLWNIRINCLFNFTLLSPQ